MRIFYSFAIIFLFLSTTLAQLPEYLEVKESIIKSERIAATHKLKFTATELATDYDIKYHKLDWEIDPAEQYIKGVITTDFVPLTEGFQAIHFDCDDNLTVTEARIDSTVLDVERLEDDVIKINFPQSLKKGDLYRIEVEYEGAPTTLSRAFVSDSSISAPFVWTLSEPYGAKDWWPCKQTLNDKIDSIDIHVTTDEGYEVASNGVLVDETTSNGKVEFHWEHNYPIPAYLIAIAVTDYARFSDYAELPSGDSVEILNYVYPELEEIAKQQLMATVNLIKLYSELFGDYPFKDEKYGHAQFGWGGGMEHQTMSFMGGFNFSLQAHELAHQWFGDKVTCGSWQDIWLNEGFASYLTGLAYENVSQNSWNDWKRYTRLGATQKGDGSVYVYDTTSINRIFNGRLTYDKAAYVLHMLRWVLGDETFYTALRNYLNDPELAYGYAHTEDLINHLEEESGKDLSEFFSDWLYNEGYPTYKIRWYRTDVRGLFEYRISQEQSDASVDFFEMPIPIKIFGINGGDTTVIINNTDDDQFGTISLNNMVIDSIAFDPQQWILTRDAQIFEVTSTEGVKYSETVQLSPNPARNQLRIDPGKLISKIDRIQLIDLNGRVLNSYEGTKRSLNLNTVSDGTYFLRFIVGGKYFTKKLIKQ